ncbi:uncharacterized protein LOC129598590 [Paramacrobiotus metropolitanus]|uniref:uncharacterized protein LOC129598590 n=1 Tax=Paramacrobiotus metropolitanus TaxID=2943436 RepID=UPI002445962A|nr:uncharacterized protein LOC129598590 [Paramacrobiotus metropolitanus]
METTRILFVLLLIHAFAAAAEAKWVNVNGRFVNPSLPWTLWPNNQVPFYIDPLFTPEEEKDVRAAMQIVQSSLDDCVVFVEVSPVSEVFKLRITPYNNDRHALSDRCRTYPGKMANFEKAGWTEQPLVLTAGPAGCVGQGPRPLLKYFVLVLGKRNEHQRPNRDEYVHINEENLDAASRVAYKKYSDDEFFSACSDYDYCSVTHNQPMDFTSNGTAGFIVKKEPYFIPQLDHLGECDCMDLKILYGCTPNCKKLNCGRLKMLPPPMDAREQCSPGQATPIRTQSIWTSVESSPTMHRVCYTISASSGAMSRSVSTTIEPMGQQRQAGGLCQVTASTGGMGNPSVGFSISFGMRQKREILSPVPTQRALNFDPKFAKWPGNTVPYYLDPSYTPEEQKRIKDAFTQLSTELGGCIVFSEVPATAPVFKVKITATESIPGTFPARGCHTLPGASRDRIGVGKNEQEMLIRTGPNGCVNDNQTLLRLAAMVLGKRYEHQRQDRDDALTINDANISPDMKSLFDKYTFQNASLFCAYDYCSVTHIRIEEFSGTVPGGAFSVKNPPFRIARLNKLSECDCKELSVMYNCPLERCVPLNCSAIPPALPPPGTVFSPPDRNVSKPRNSSQQP